MTDIFYEDLKFNNKKTLRETIERMPGKPVKAVKEHVTNEKDEGANLVVTGFDEEISKFELLGINKHGLRDVDAFVTFDTDIKEVYKKRVSNNRISGTQGRGRLLALKFCEGLVFSFNCSKPVIYSKSNGRSLRGVRITLMKSHDENYLSKPKIEVDERPNRFLRDTGGKVEYIDVDRAYTRDFRNLGSTLPNEFGFALLTGELTIRHNGNDLTAPKFYRDIYKYNNGQLSEYTGEKCGSAMYASMPYDGPGEAIINQNGITVESQPYINVKGRLIIDVGNSIDLDTQRQHYDQFTPAGAELDTFIRDKMSQFEQTDQEQIIKVKQNRATKTINEQIGNYLGLLIYKEQQGRAAIDLSKSGGGLTERLFSGAGEDTVTGVAKDVIENGYMSEDGDVNGRQLTCKTKESRPREILPVVIDVNSDEKVKVKEIQVSVAGKQYEVVAKTVRRGGKNHNNHMLGIYPVREANPEVYPTYHDSIKGIPPFVVLPTRNKIHSEIFTEYANYKDKGSAKLLVGRIVRVIVPRLYPYLSYEDQIKKEDEIFHGVVSAMRRGGAI